MSPGPGFASDDGPMAESLGVSCSAGAVSVAHSLSANRDRLIADLAERKATDSCSLWASLNKAERYIFLMDTAYMADKSSRLYPPGAGSVETALDHAVALYSINGPKAGQGTNRSGLGGENYNRIYLGFDSFAACVMRNFTELNPKHDPEFNQWRKSNDTGGPHHPFTAREMIFWGTWTNEVPPGPAPRWRRDMQAGADSNSLGPTFHHWRRSSDFDQRGVDRRLGVCGVTDPTLTELTIAFDFFHDSDPLGDYGRRGGYGWQIVDQHVGLRVHWDYTPGGCSVTAPLNDRIDGGGTFNGLGPAHAASCAAPALDGE